MYLSADKTLIIQKRVQVENIRVEENGRVSPTLDLQILQRHRYNLECLFFSKSGFVVLLKHPSVPQSNW